METYFHEDPRIEEWVEQITEKIFTVCLLTGVNSEVEFQSGIQIVSRVTNLLHSISIFPSEYLEDALKQLIEQQLPDSRVINNFPKFQENMNIMIREGIRNALENQNIEKLSNIATTKLDTPEKTTDYALDRSSERCDDDIENSGHYVKGEFVPQMVIAALASASVGLPARLSELMGISEDSSSVITSTVASVVPSTPTNTYGILRKSQVPERAERLNQVLTNFFPNVSVCWNFSLKGQQFLAQVEDILIWLDNQEQSCPVDDLNIQGWKVYECRSTDLMFPRRLERGIRQIQRQGRNSKNV
ncbi:MAG TPA: hypothetical protein VFC84_00490 [Desulfosporosinus sp.]|nr:hypothetical protein [Desulfosporosinus sp.]